MKVHPVVAKLFDEDGQTDKHDEANFANAPEKYD
jgi:hypothetical protein